MPFTPIPSQNAFHSCSLSCWNWSQCCSRICGINCLFSSIRHSRGTTGTGWQTRYGLVWNSQMSLSQAAIRIECHTNMGHTETINCLWCTISRKRNQREPYRHHHRLLWFLSSTIEFSEWVGHDSPLLDDLLVGCGCLWNWRVLCSGRNVPS